MTISKAKKKHRIWPNVVRFLAKRNPPTITAAQLAEAEKMEYGSALQVLRSLRKWGYIALAGFESSGGPGRRRHVFEVCTDKCRRYADR
jgi:hypothetical protein